MNLVFKKFLITKSNIINVLKIVGPTLVIPIIFFSLNTMWIHPDSMASGGLRFLKTGLQNFHYGTYGPFSFLFIGFSYALLFPFGLIFGLWSSNNEFEIAYRTNHVELIDISFTKLSLIINVTTIIVALYILSSIKIDRNYQTKQTEKIILIFFSIPISLFQFSLDTIEVFVFLGISLAIFSSFAELERPSKPGLKSYCLVASTFLLTVGLRPNLVIFVLPVFLLVAQRKYVTSKNKSEWSPIFISCLIVILTYFPLLTDAAEFQSFLNLTKNLSEFHFDSQTIIRNFGVMIINLGLIGLISLFLISNLRFHKAFQNDFDRVHYLWRFLILIQIILFAFNKNGFPKYLVPVIPMIILEALFFLDKVTNSTPRKFGMIKMNHVRFLLILSLMVMSSMNYLHFQSISKFDSREILTKVVPEDIRWTGNAIANVTVISELTRGNTGLDFDSLNSKIKTFDSNNPICDDIVILSSRETKLRERTQIYKDCSSQGYSYMILEILTVKDLALSTIDSEWSGLLSLGTKADRNRIGYGPNYSIYVSTNSKFINDFKDRCLKSSVCRISEP